MIESGWIKQAILPYVTITNIGMKIDRIKIWLEMGEKGYLLMSKVSWIGLRDIWRWWRIGIISCSTQLFGSWREIYVYYRVKNIFNVVLNSFKALADIQRQYVPRLHAHWYLKALSHFELLSL